MTIEDVDKNGVTVKHGELDVSLEVEGAGELIAVCAANPISDEPYVGNQRKAFQGRLLTVVRATGQEGEITLKARTEGLPAAQIQLQVN